MPALRESFRLPGEVPVVERILEVFSGHWLVSRMSIVLESYCMSSVVLHVCDAISLWSKVNGMIMCGNGVLHH